MDVSVYCFIFYTLGRQKVQKIKKEKCRRDEGLFYVKTNSVKKYKIKRTADLLNNATESIVKF